MGTQHHLQTAKASRAPIFSYEKYSEEVASKFQKEREKRMLDLMENKAVRSIETYTDDIYKQEVESLYGEMDESSQRFKLILKNYKKERLDQIEEWIKEETEFSISQELAIIELKDETPAINVPHNNALQSKEIKTSFYSNKNGLPINPFILPRKKKSTKEVLTDFRNKQKGLKGLAEFDPELNLDKNIVPPSCLKALGYPLVEQIVNTARKYPSGICCNAFISELKRIVGSTKAVNKSQFALEEIMEKFGSQFVFTQDLPGRGNLYFPRCLQGLIVAPIQMLENIWHKIRVVLNLHLGIVKLSTAIQYSCDIFGWKKIYYEAWGFRSEDDFVQYLIDYWRDEVKLISEMQLKRKGRSNVLYLVMVVNPQQKRLINSFLGPSPNRLPTSTSLTLTQDIDRSSSSKTQPIQKPHVWNSRGHGQQQMPKAPLSNYASKTSSTLIKHESGFPSLGQPVGKSKTIQSSQPPQPKSWNKLF